MVDSSFSLGRAREGRERQRVQSQIIGGIPVLVLFDVVIEVPDVEQKRCALATVEVGQDSILYQPAKLPFTDAQIFGGLSGAKEAGLDRGRKTQGAPRLSSHT
jgi:hypothetical protein